MPVDIIGVPGGGGGGGGARAAGGGGGGGGAKAGAAGVAAKEVEVEEVEVEDEAPPIFIFLSNPPSLTNASSVSCSSSACPQPKTRGSSISDDRMMTPFGSFGTCHPHNTPVL